MSFDRLRRCAESGKSFLLQNSESASYGMEAIGSRMAQFVAPLDFRPQEFVPVKIKLIWEVPDRCQTCLSLLTLLQRPANVGRMTSKKSGYLGSKVALLQHGISAGSPALVATFLSKSFSDTQTPVGHPIAGMRRSDAASSPRPGCRRVRLKSGVPDRPIRREKAL